MPDPALRLEGPGFVLRPWRSDDQLHDLRRFARVRDRLP
jgi:hypothetical protein